jgi:hypothetical protein
MAETFIQELQKTLVVEFKKLESNRVSCCQVISNLESQIAAATLPLTFGNLPAYNYPRYIENPDLLRAEETASFTQCGLGILQLRLDNYKIGLSNLEAQLSSYSDAAFFIHRVTQAVPSITPEDASSEAYSLKCHISAVNAKFTTHSAASAKAAAVFTPVPRNVPKSSTNNRTNKVETTGQRLDRLENLLAQMTMKAPRAPKNEKAAAQQVRGQRQPFITLDAGRKKGDSSPAVGKNRGRSRSRRPPPSSPTRATSMPAHPPSRLNGAAMESDDRDGGILSQQRVNKRQRGLNNA